MDILTKAYPTNQPYHFQAILSWWDGTDGLCWNSFVDEGKKITFCLKWRITKKGLFLFSSNVLTVHDAGHIWAASVSGWGVTVHHGEGAGGGEAVARPPALHGRAHPQFMLGCQLRHAIVVRPAKIWNQSNLNLGAPRFFSLLWKNGLFQCCFKTLNEEHGNKRNVQYNYRNIAKRKTQKEAKRVRWKRTKCETLMNAKECEKIQCHIRFCARQKC